MCRYTVILIEGQSGDREKRGFWSLLEENLRGFTSEEGVFSVLKPNIVIVLSNGISRDKHLEIHKVLSNNSLQVRIASVLHESPVLALIKASRILERSTFYYEEGEEKEYIIGYFSFKPRRGGGIIDEFTHRRLILYKVLRFLEYTGSLPIEISINNILAVLSKKSEELVDELKEDVVLKTARGLHAKSLVSEVTRE
jgi:GTP cyclohydrolase III